MGILQDINSKFESLSGHSNRPPDWGLVALYSPAMPAGRLVIIYWLSCRTETVDRLGYDDVDVWHSALWYFHPYRWWRRNILAPTVILSHTVHECALSFSSSRLRICLLLFAWCMILNLWVWLEGTYGYGLLEYSVLWFPGVSIYKSFQIFFLVRFLPCLIQVPFHDILVTTPDDTLNRKMNVIRYG